MQYVSKENLAYFWEKIKGAIAGSFVPQDVVDLIYPVGSVYMSFIPTKPATLFGGTWVQLKDRFLLGAGDTYANGTTGGEATHKLTTNEIPAHTHGSKSLTGSFGTGALQGANSVNLFNNVSGIFSRASASSGKYNTTGTNKDSMYNKINIDASHEHSSVGGNGSHNNMPPYLVVYMWKRTA